MTTTEPNFEELTEWLKGKINAHTGSTFVIGLAGGSCSGKSRLADQLRDYFAGDLVTLHLDDFQLGEEFPLKGTSNYRWDDPANFAPEESAQCLKQLLAEGKTVIPSFDLATNRRIGRKTITINRIVLVEGLYALSAPIRDFCDVGIYCEASFFCRFTRRWSRFISEVKPDSEIPIRHMLTSVYDSHQDYVVPQRLLADQVVKSSYNFEAESLSRVEKLAKTYDGVESGSKIFGNGDCELLVVEDDQIGIILRFKGIAKRLGNVNRDLLTRLKLVDWTGA